jgi:hypothetical protein
MFGLDDLANTVVGIAGKLVDKLIPDPQAAAEAKYKLLALAQDGTLKQLMADTDLAKAQDAINQVEAGNSSLFVAGWRPFVGWICGGALGFNYMIAPLGNWVAALGGSHAVIPTLDFAVMSPILTGMLGFGAMRTYEKVNGIKAGQ